METGMLWCDEDSRTDLSTKIGRAAAYYMDKFGLRPNVCYVHPSQMPAQRRRRDGILVMANSHLRPGHLWLGVLSSSR